jgi:hypothetical protein
VQHQARRCARLPSLAGHASPRAPALRSLLNRPVSCPLPSPRPTCADFETLGINFTEHCANEHNPEFYIFFHFYLLEKDPNDFTGQEHYVHSCIQQKLISFFPLKKAKRIQGLAQQSKRDVPALHTRLDHLEGRLRDQSHSNKQQNAAILAIDERLKGMTAQARLRHLRRTRPRPPSSALAPEPNMAHNLDSQLKRSTRVQATPRHRRICRELPRSRPI